jgi:hypothetical protein
VSSTAVAGGKPRVPDCRYGSASQIVPGGFGRAVAVVAAFQSSIVDGEV